MEVVRILTAKVSHVREVSYWWSRILNDVARLRKELLVNVAGIDGETDSQLAVLEALANEKIQRCDAWLQKQEPKLSEMIERLVGDES